MSIKERIGQIQENSANWRQRVRSFRETDRSPVQDVSQIRQTLFSSQQGWKNRVSVKDVSNFTVEARIEQATRHDVRRSSTVHVTDPTRLQSNSITSKLRELANKAQPLPLLPIQRLTSKENLPTPKSTVEPQTPSHVPEVITQKVMVPRMEDDNLASFFTSPPPLLQSNAIDDFPPPDQFTPPSIDQPPSQFHTIAQARRALRPQRRKPQTIESLAHLANQPMVYEEIRPSNALASQITSPLRRVLNSHETGDRHSHLASAAIAGLSSREDFSNVRSKLRRSKTDAPLSSYQRQLLPYKPVMLLHIKGRRHVQTRLVCPSPESLNSGDCFVLVTSKAVFVWLGAFANVVEVNKAQELASWIHKHHELCFRADGGGASEPIIVRDDPRRFSKTTTDDPTTDTRRSRASQASMEFWKALGCNEPQEVRTYGSPDEDELFESLIQHSTRIYEVTSEQLVPCESSWGALPRHSLLASNKAFVFDFGSEVYLWTGSQIDPEIRHAGIEMVQQAYSAPYDFSCCGLNPLDPLSSHESISASGPERPEWTLVGRVTEKGETVLFKEKFTDWPEPARIGIRCDPRSRRKFDDSTSVYSEIKPHPAKELYNAMFNDPPPAPTLLTLEGRFVGRGGAGCRYEDGIARRYRVESGQILVWHVSEFSRNEVPSISHGQFFSGDTYVIRWPFCVINVGLRDVHDKSTEPVSNEQCAYFFWQGSQSKVAEKGAAALMTVELDEERGPQLRVLEGQEPPAFCRLFNGRMVIHQGRRGTTSDPKSLRVFLVRGEVPAESYLLEVPPNLSSLRPQGAFLILQYNTSSDVEHAWVWFGRFTPEATVRAACHIVSQLKDSCPPELGPQLGDVIEVNQTDEFLGPEELVALLKQDHRLSSPAYATFDRARDALSLWQLDLANVQQLGARRVTYPLQPDVTLVDARPSKMPRQLSEESTPMDMAKAVAERLRSSNQLVSTSIVKNSENFLSFPYLLGDLYEATQPAFFLLTVGRKRVYVWQGWWPSTSRGYIPSDQPEEMNQETSTSADEVESSHVEESVTGSAKGRFGVVRRAVFKTAHELAGKIGCEAFVVYAGLEPVEFLCLFPPYERDSEASRYHLQKEGKVDGQLDEIGALLAAAESATYTLAELQKRPLPADLDATNLEMYLNPDEFQTAFSMSKEEFDCLPTWKKLSLKRRIGLF